MSNRWHPKLRRAYDYWLKIRPNADALPGRQHLDPTDVPDLLPHLFLVDVTKEPLRFHYRLMGTSLVNAVGRDITGMWFDEAFPDFRGSALEEQMSAVVRNAKLSYHKGPLLASAEREFLWIERLLLPLARDGSNVDMLMGVSLFGPSQKGLEII